MPDDRELSRRAARGDREAAGEIYDRHAPLVRAILLDATGSLSEANDLLQEVFLRALGNLRQLRDPDKLAGWIVGIARREGADFCRRRVRERQRFEPLIDDPAHASDNEEIERTKHVRAAISTLPERERIAVHIHYLSGEPVDVARQVLGLSTSGFYKLLERARERLRVRLGELEERR